MKKRMLSVLLALTLCFTAFAGMAGAAGAPSGRLERNVDRLDNTLTNVATDEQQNAINGVEAPDVTADQKPWSDIIDYLLNDTVLEKDGDLDVTDMTVRPYFFMRWLEERAAGESYDGITKDINNYPRIMELVADFQATNKKYDVSQGNLMDGLAKFDDYSTEISNELNAFVEDTDGQIELLAYAGIIDELGANVEIVGDNGEKLTVEELYGHMMDQNFATLDEALKYLNDHTPGTDIDTNAYTVDNAKSEILFLGEEQARIEVVILLQKLVDFACSDSSENYVFQQTEGNILAAYRAIMKDDESMKNGAIIIGKDTLNLVSYELVTPLRNFVKDEFDAVDILKNNPDVKKILGKDKDAAVDAMHSFVKSVLIAKVNETDNETVNKITDSLAARGFSLDELYDLEEAAMKAVDPDKLLQIIWFDLGLNRVLNVKSVPGAVKEDGKTVDQNVDLSFSHRFVSKFTKSGTDDPQVLQRINKLVPGFFYINIDDPDAVTVTDDLGTTTTLEKYGLTFLQGDGAHLLTYDATKVPEGTVLPVTIYRGPDALGDEPAVERYIETAEIALTSASVEPPVTDKEITLTSPAGEKHYYLDGDEILIKGTSKNFELISIYIEAPGSVRFLYTAVTAADFANGVTYKLPDEAVIGTYKVFAGDNDKTASATFEVVGDGKAQIVREDQPFADITNKRKNTKWEDLGVPSEITLLTADGEKAGTATITWLTDADKATGYKGYDPKDTKVQVINGTYEISEIVYDTDKYVGVVENAEGYAYPIDGKTQIRVDLKSTSSGGSTTTRYANFLEDEMSFDGNTNIVKVKGETNFNNVTIDVVAPDGTVITSVQKRQSELINGFDLDLSEFAPLGIGVYTLKLKANDTVWDEYTFTVNPITFMVTDHINYVMGYEDGTVRPNANITRDEVAAMLFRLLNDNYRKGWLTNSTNKYSDLPAGIWSMTPIATMTTAGVINGYPDGTFGTGKEITRAEFAAMCARMSAAAVATANPYSDIDDSWAKDEITTVTAMGWFQGDENGQFRPNDKLTRAEAITVINRMLGRDKVTAESFANLTVAEFSDLDADAWYYAAIVEATTAHDHEMANGAEVWTKTEAAEDWTTFEK